MKTSENKRRVMRCQKALRPYGVDDSDPYALIDLLVDARHWCDQHRQSFGDLDRMAYEHYLAERRGDRVDGGEFSA